MGDRNRIIKHLDEQVKKHQNKDGEHVYINKVTRTVYLEDGTHFTFEDFVNHLMFSNDDE